MSRKIRVGGRLEGKERKTSAKRPETLADKRKERERYQSVHKYNIFIQRGKEERGPIMVKPVFLVRG